MRDRCCALALAGSLTLAPAPSEAIPPVLLLVAKQIVQDAAKSILKDMLLSSLRDMGCKGMALANAFELFDLRKGAGGGTGMLGILGSSMPKMPPGMAMPALPAGMNVPAMAGAVPGLAGTEAMSAGLAEGMHEMMSGAGQLQVGVDPGQVALLMQAMGRPLSPPETLAVIDELGEIGFLPKTIQGELKECLVLLPAAAPALGMGMAMLKPMIPQVRQARDAMHALTPEEQDELGAGLLQEIRQLPADERKSLVEFVEAGFFPKRVADALRSGVSTR